jgi:hypothetical protein
MYLDIRTCITAPGTEREGDTKDRAIPSKKDKVER